mgnify:CR=1 FL=1
MNSIDQNKGKNNFTILEEVKNCMTNGLKISSEAMEIDFDPIKTMPSIKFVEACEDDEEEINAEQKSVKVISSCSSNVG